jgi:hypothetical protein
MYSLIMITGKPNSKSFDITLMICLLRNIANITKPRNGFDRLPHEYDKSPGADLARIKYYRNYIVHLDWSEIENDNFISAWNDISAVSSRLHLKQTHIFCFYHKVVKAKIDCLEIRTQCPRRPTCIPVNLCVSEIA